MATTTLVDYRRDDVRRYDHHVRYWMTSAEFGGVADDDKCALLFSFPAAKYGGLILIHNVLCQITTLYAGGTITLDIGSCTLATDNVTTAGVSTDVDKDEYIPTADITSGTAAIYPALTGDWITAYLLKTNLTPVTITPADTTVPCIAAYTTSDAAITAGNARVIIEISEVPVV